MTQSLRISTLLLCLIALFSFSNAQNHNQKLGFEVPEGYRLSQTWQGAWHHMMGNIDPIKWITSEAETSEYVLEAYDASSFIVIAHHRSPEHESLGVFAEDMEAGIFEGDHTELFSSEGAKYPDGSTCTVDLQGAIAGQFVDLRCTMVQLESGDFFKIFHVAKIAAYDFFNHPADVIARSLEFTGGTLEASTK